ncbi:MAG TPA: YegS/Rv2252/BmrU family lipid kinase [Acidobacteriaceae bacterium]|nr:YegS/Rv2252/BmrU family lipid kinase [Acidobacteriaceae bacterium]
MHRAALIYNPASGQRPAKRAARIAQAIRVFDAAGIEVETIATVSPESAAQQARHAVSEGFDTILACGGDGTVHEVMQGLVGLRDVALGVIPMGTANALASDLGIPSSAGKAAKALLDAVPVRVPVGRIFYRDANGAERSRYFTVAAGVGVDAHFFSRLDSRLKQRFGYLAYLIQALHLWATHSFPMFRAYFHDEKAGNVRTADLSQLLAVRISNFGGAVQNLVPGAALHKEGLSAVAIGTSSRLRYLRFMVAVWCRSHSYRSPIELIEAKTIQCEELETATTQTYVEADGELLGTLPARIEVVPDALTLLVPARAAANFSLAP